MIQSLRFLSADTLYTLHQYIEIPTAKDNITWYTPIVSKCACSTMLKMVIENLGLDVNRGKYDSLKGEWRLLSDIKLKTEDFKENHKTFAVIRDPLERIESAYTTIGGNMSVDEYVENILLAFGHLHKLLINRHIVSQFLFYDVSKIDVFVPIEKLDEWFEYIGANNNGSINCSRQKIKIDDERLMEYLKEDYEIYNLILSSDKMF